LDEDEMFYLESRGINPALAKNMLTYGFAEEVIEKITIDRSSGSWTQLCLIG
jgi:Fe-S cluster assembly protein SufD